METLGSGAAVLDLLFQIGSYRSILFDFGTDVSSWTFEFYLKKNKGDRLKTLSLTLGSGLSFPVYASDQVQAILTSANATIEEGQYYYEFRRTDINIPLVNGFAYFTFDAPQGTAEETTLSLNVLSQTISVTISGVPASPAETTTTIGTLINSATAKNTPVDADLIPISDSAASFILKKITWANIKAALKTYFDTLYQAAGSYLTSTNIEDAINDGTTTKAPSENAVFDALALKVNSAGSKVIQLAASDETTALTAGIGKITFRMPYAMTVTAVRASLGTAQTSGSIFTVDINESGTSIISTKLTIDNTEKTSTTAVTPPVISDASLADDAEITIDIDQIGDGTAKGLKITLIGS